MGGGMGSFVEGLAGGVQQGQKMRMASELQAMQMTHLKTTNKAAEIELLMKQKESDLFGQLTPEQQLRTKFPKANDPIELLKTLGFGGATPQPTQVPLPDYSPGEGMPPFRPGATMTVPQQIAQGQVGGLQLDSVDLGTGAIKLGPTEFQSIRGVALPGQAGPQTIRVPKTAGGAFPEYQAPDMVTEQLASGETVEYKMDKTTNQPVPGTMRIKTRVAPIDQKSVLGDGTEVTQRVNPFTNEPVGGEISFKGVDGKISRITAPPPVEEFKFTDPKDGIDKSVVRNKQTGVFVTTPIPVAPIKGALITEAGKIEGATKALRIFGDIKKALINPDGSLNRNLVFKIWTPGGGIGEGRKFLSQFREGLDVKTRVMSGAAIRPEEEAMYKAIYLPHPLDNDDTARDKLKRFQETMQGLLAISDPAGLGAGRVEKATGGKKKPDLSLGKKKPLSEMTDDELRKAAGE